MCLLMHFFGIFSVKRLQEALKLILTLIMTLILLNGVKFSYVLVVLTLLGNLCMVLSNTYTLCLFREYLFLKASTFYIEICFKIYLICEA